MKAVEDTIRAGLREEMMKHLSEDFGTKPIKEVVDTFLSGGIVESLTSEVMAQLKEHGSNPENRRGHGQT